MEKGWFVDLRNLDDLAVRGRNDNMLTALADALRVAEEVSDPDREDDENNRGQPQRPGPPIEGKRKRPGGDQCRNDDEEQSFAREAHVDSVVRVVPVIRRYASR